MYILILQNVLVDPESPQNPLKYHGPHKHGQTGDGVNGRRVKISLDERVCMQSVIFKYKSVSQGLNTERERESMPQKVREIVIAIDWLILRVTDEPSLFSLKRFHSSLSLPPSLAALSVVLLFI